VLFGHYEKAVDRESAYEKLKQRSAETSDAEAAAPAPKGRAAEPQSESAKLFGAMAKSAAHAIGSQIGRQIIRGVLGSILGGGRKS
jgi:hypothetical protein